MPQSLRTRVAYQPQVGDQITRIHGTSSRDIEVLTILGMTGERIQIKYYWPFEHDLGPLVWLINTADWTQLARRAHRVEEGPCPK